MAKTPVGKDYTDTTKFLADVVEPRFKKIIEEVNKFLATRKIQVGAEIQWLIESTEKDDAGSKKN